jgi:hypothetical protein
LGLLQFAHCKTSIISMLGMLPEACLGEIQPPL